MVSGTDEYTVVTPDGVDESLQHFVTVVWPD